jgi:protoporphyrinogen oxidase
VKWRINGKEEYDSIISTIPLPVIGSVYGSIPDDIQASISALKYNSLNTVLFDCPKTDITWLYIPSHDYRSHRVGYQSTLTPNACPNQESRGCGALEIIGSKINDIDKLFKQNVLPNELGFLNPIDSEFTEYAYVIHNFGYEKNTSHIKRYFESQEQFYLLGRWGTWNYKNMDLCMNDAMELVDKYFT